MQRRVWTILVSVLGVCFLCLGLACNGKFSKGIKKDLMTGLSVTYDGFTIDEAVLLDSNGQTLSSNQVGLESKIKIKITGLDGFHAINGQVFPGASILVTDTNQVAILDEKELFSEYDSTGCSIEDSRTITLSVTVGDPMQEGNLYIWKSRVWDKKGKAYLDINQEFKVIQP